MSINPVGVNQMLENEILRFQQELAELKQDLLTSEPQPPEDVDSYQIATRLDLIVNRMVRILEHRAEANA